MIFRSWFDLYRPSVYQEASGTGCLRHLYLRHAAGTGEIMVCLVANGEPPATQLPLQYVNRRGAGNCQHPMESTTRKRPMWYWGSNSILYGERRALAYQLCGLSLTVAPMSFYQVNHRQTERLYQVAAGYAALSPGSLLLDLYCSTGTIGLTMAKQAGRLIRGGGRRIRCKRRQRKCGTEWDPKRRIPFVWTRGKRQNSSPHRAFVRR